jgi:hypothetical protein
MKPKIPLRYTCFILDDTLTEYIQPTAMKGSAFRVAMRSLYESDGLKVIRARK